MRDLITLAFTALLIENVLLFRFLGVCPFLGVSKKRESAIGMGMAVIFVIVLATTVSWLVYYYILDQFDLIYMRTIVFIFVIASLVQIVEMFMKKVLPALYKSLGIFLPLITTNCAVLGVAILAVDKEYNFIEMLVFALASSAGFLLVMFIFSALREKMESAPTPKGFKGIPIALVTAAVLAMVFGRLGGII
ncbi:MAG TPA: RnfABCDGE type electron transport complex subunit A [Bacilli bacterium]|nr:RnfABCDGE type electron transport complex subunit A [Bacilli bacterium]